MDKKLSILSTTPASDDMNDDMKTAVTPVDFSADVVYEALDYQLAALMLELNDFVPDEDSIDVSNSEKNKKTLIQALEQTLKQSSLEISKRTREGQIVQAISSAQQRTLLQTTVVGETGEYMPLIIERGIDNNGDSSGSESESESEDGDSEGGYLYLHRYWQYQQRLATQINARIATKESVSETQKTWTNTRLADYFKTNTDSADINWQKRAVELALKNKLLIVSGGPGTGKTTTITRLLALLIEQHLRSQLHSGSGEHTTIKTAKKGGGVISLSNNTTDSKPYSILLAAPTGKAAIRMLDSIREVSQSLQAELSLEANILSQMPKQASTIHKLLGYKPNSAEFKHHRDNPLHADVVLVDEASMIDIALMSKLVDAVPEHAKLILIGDKDQLSSVETGSVFADMCAGLKGSENLVSLKKNWRFATDSDIGQCAIAANHGDSNTFLRVLNDTTRSATELILPANMHDAELIQPWQHYFAVLNNPDSSLPDIFAAFNQYRILCALRRGTNGSQTINSRIETALEKQGLIKRRRSSNQQYSNWYHGRPIMISQNSYSRGLFNGDTGITLLRDGKINVFFATADSFVTADGSVTNVAKTDSYNRSHEGFKAFSPIRLPAHETTWAMTIHKSQGSEFNQVVLILPQQEMPLLTRQLLYTGVTRAKQKVSIVASDDVLIAGVKAETLKATRIDQHIKY